jgi:hypothetical protein
MTANSFLQSISALLVESVLRYCHCTCLLASIIIWRFDVSYLLQDSCSAVRLGRLKMELYGFLKIQLCF